MIKFNVYNVMKIIFWMKIINVKNKYILIDVKYLMKTIVFNALKIIL